MVTVKVTDNGVANKNKMSATRDVMITVTNAEEDGTVKFSSVQPKVGIPFTAILNDPDGETTGAKWAWASTDEVSAGACPGEDVIDWAVIAGEKSETYTPKFADATDAGKCLRATASYTEPSRFHYGHGRVRQRGR